jgi:hypothetical protein
MINIKNESVYQTTLKDIKKMFAGEHVLVVADIFGTKYINKKTKKQMPEHKALKILAGDY